MIYRNVFWTCWSLATLELVSENTSELFRALRKGSTLAGVILFPKSSENDQQNQQNYLIHPEPLEIQHPTPPCHRCTHLMARLAACWITWPTAVNQSLDRNSIGDSHLGTTFSWDENNRAAPMKTYDVVWYIYIFLVKSEIYIYIIYLYIYICI